MKTRTIMFIPFLRINPADVTEAHRGTFRTISRPSRVTRCMEKKFFAYKRATSLLLLLLLVVYFPFRIIITAVYYILSSLLRNSGT